MKFFYILVFLIFFLLNSCSSGSTEKYINKETPKIEIKDSIFVDSIRIKTH
tara:strand:+ start:680 stop:832 length:153 start_codon:yes stop_codon:yes gene_type:complete